MFDTDKFIECIHSIPALWDKSAAEYADKNVRDRAWIDIGIVMYEDWNSETLKERDERVKEMKKKWRHIRDHFLRVSNKEKSGESAPSKKKRKYLYADALTFLMNSETKRPTSGNIPLSEDKDMDKSQEKEGEAEEMGQVPEKPATEKFRNTPLKKKLTPQSQILRKSSTIEEDVDRLYLLSMLSDYKALTEIQKLDFKLMTLQFFRNVRTVPQSQIYPMMPLFNHQLNPMQQSYMPQSSSQSQPPHTAQPMKQGTTPLYIHPYDQYSSSASSNFVSPSAQSINSDCSD